MGVKGRAKITIAALVAALGVAIITAYVVYLWLCRRGVGESETSASLPGDDVVLNSTSGHTLALSIAAPPSQVWPWLVQMGQGSTLLLSSLSRRTTWCSGSCCRAVALVAGRMSFDRQPMTRRASSSGVAAVGLLSLTGSWCQATTSWTWVFSEASRKEPRCDRNGE